MTTALRDMIHFAHGFDDESVSSVIDNYLVTEHQYASLPRRAKVFHPSGMGHPCLRKLQLEFLGVGVAKRTPTAKQEATFEFGHAVHDLVQKWTGFAGRLVGDWECKECHARREFCTVPDREGCPKPRDERGFHFWKYRELTTTDEDLGIYGHCDGIILLRTNGKMKPWILEAKSSNAKWFRERVREGGPLGGHRIQAHAYMYCWGIPRARILYVNKDSTEKVEFVVPFNKFLWLRLASRLRAVREANALKYLIARHEVKPSLGVCRSCFLSDVCWSTDKYERALKVAETGRVE